MINHLWPHDSPEDPVSRLGLSADSSAIPIVIGHMIYHGLKQGNPHLLRRARSLKDLSGILTLGEDMGRVIASELGSSCQREMMHRTGGT